MDEDDQRFRVTVRSGEIVTDIVEFEPVSQSEDLMGKPGPFLR